MAIILEAGQSAEMVALRRRRNWLAAARPKQLFPEKETWWNIAMILAGRGFGKTRPFAEDAWWNCHTYPNIIYHIVARTDSDLTKTCFEGESGLQACCPPEVLYKGSWDKAYNSGDQLLSFANGSKVLGFAAMKPSSMRGPQCHRMWGDEVAAWEENGQGKAKEAFDMAALGCRLPMPDGKPSRMMLSTTPKPLNLIRDLIRRNDIIVRTGSLYENIGNLSENFKKVILPLEGTRLGDQEIHGKILDMEELGIVKRSWFPLWPAHRRGCNGIGSGCTGCNPLPKFEFILNSYDTAMTEQTRDKKKNEPDYTACGTYGAFRPVPNARMRFMLIDTWMERMDYPALKARIKLDMKTPIGQKPYQRLPDLTVVENKGSGIQIRQELADINPTLQGYNPGTLSKLTRLHLASPMAKQGYIWLAESETAKGHPKSWYSDFLNQVCSFSGEGSIDFDDHVDQFSQACDVLKKLDLVQLDTPPPSAYDESSDADDHRGRGNPYDQ